MLVILMLPRFGQLDRASLRYVFESLGKPPDRFADVATEIRKDCCEVASKMAVICPPS